MRIRMRMKDLVLVGGVIAMSVTCFMTQGVSATTLPTLLSEKAIYQGVYNCYTLGAMTPEFSPLSSYGGRSGDFVDNGSISFPVINDGEYTSGILASGRLSCENLFVGSGYNKGIFNMVGKTVPKANDYNVVDFMENMGYKVNGNRDAECYSLEYIGKYSVNAEGNSYYTNSVCQSEETISVSGENGDVKFGMLDGKLWLVINGGVVGKGIPIEGKKIDGDFLMRLVRESCGLNGENAQRGAAVVCTDFGKYYEFVDDSISKGYDLKNLSAVLKDDKKDAANTAIQYLSDENFNNENIGIDGLGERLLYQHYLTDFYGAEVDCEEHDGLGVYIGEINWYENGNVVTNCRYRYKSGDRHKNDKVNGLDGGGFLSAVDTLGRDDVIEKLRGLPIDYSDDEKAAYVALGLDNDKGGDTGKECKKYAGPLGWVLCSVMEKVADALGQLYESAVEPFLVIEPELLSSGETRKVWETVIGFANIFIVMYLLVVIFSQLTGFGIDNYGIKKTLPKIIVAAILINLSFLICSLAVDLSNIVGNGLNNLLKGVAVGSDSLTVTGDAGSTTIVVDSSDNTAWFDTMFAVAGGGMVAVGTLSLASGVLAAGFLAGLIIPLLLFFVTALFAVLFFFILLGVRKAGVILLVILAPLAIVCYTLPNTKKYFTKWRQAFTGLLLLYPICGLLIGGGQLASKILVNASGDYMTYLIGCMILVVPFFFIPTLLKGSFAAMGNIGAKISGIGKNLGTRTRGKLDSAVKSSPRYQARVELNKDRQKFRIAQSTQNRLNRKRARRGGLSQKDQERYLSATDIVNEHRLRSARAKVGPYEIRDEDAENRARSSLEAQERKAWDDQFAGYNQQQLIDEADNAGVWLNQRGGAQRMSALLSAMEANGMEKEMARVLTNNNIGNMAGVMQTLASSKNKVFRAYGKKGNNISYKDFMRGKDEEGNATSASLRQYVEEKGNDFIDGLDDKALAEINNYSRAGNEIMSTDQLVQAAAQLNGEDSMKEINNMLANRSDVRISGEQLTRLNNTTIERLLNNNNATRSAIVGAIESAANDPQLISKISPNKITDMLSNSNITNDELARIAGSPQAEKNNMIRQEAARIWYKRNS